MLPKKSRLPRGEFRAGAYKTVKTPYFLLKGKRSVKGDVRIGVVVGKTVHKTAVKRNFWERQAKAALMEEGPGADLLMIFSPNVTTLTKKQFRAEVKKALRALHQ